MSVQLISRLGTERCGHRVLIVVLVIVVIVEAVLLSLLITLGADSLVLVEATLAVFVTVLDRLPTVGQFPPG
jgi:hypothetical protein